MQTRLSPVEDANMVKVPTEKFPAALGLRRAGTAEEGPAASQAKTFRELACGIGPISSSLLPLTGGVPSQAGLPPHSRITKPGTRPEGLLPQPPANTGSPPLGW